MRRWKPLDESKWELLAEEHLGAQPNKYWFVNIETKERALFKPDTEAKESVFEWGAYEVARQAGVTVAKTEMVEYKGLRGCLSYDYKNIYNENSKMVYRPVAKMYEKEGLVTHRSKDSKKVKLKQIPKISLGYAKKRIPEIEEQMVDMLYLDCLISNRDRHGTNWDLAIDTSTGKIEVAPLFDHGLSLWNQYSPEMDYCLVLWEENQIELKHFDMFEKLSANYPEQIGKLLKKCVEIKKIEDKLAEFVQPRYRKMCEIFERVNELSEQGRKEELKEHPKPEKPMSPSPKSPALQRAAEEQPKIRPERQKPKPTLKERTGMARKKLEIIKSQKQPQIPRKDSRSDDSR